MNSRNSQVIVYFLLIVAIGALFFYSFRENATAKEPLTINEVAQKVQNGQVARISIGRRQLSHDDTRDPAANL